MRERESTHEDRVKNSVGSNISDCEFRVEEVGERSETLVEILEVRRRRERKGVRTKENGQAQPTSLVDRGR